MTGLVEAPHEILGRWLRAVGVPPAWIPPSYRDRRQLWQAVSAVRQLAVLIDDAPSAAVVAALRPRTGLALVTSRCALGGHGGDITRVRVNPLRRRPAAALLADEQGGTLAGLPHAAELARVCGGLPLALRCAARLAPSDLSAARLAEQLDAGQAQLVDRREHPAKALRLAGSPWPLLRARGDHDGQLTVARLGIRAARAHRDRAAEARMQARTGHALTLLGQPGKAVPSLRRAAEM